jgi:hypothetical protein
VIVTLIINFDVGLRLESHCDRSLVRRNYKSNGKGHDHILRAPDIDDKKMNLVECEEGYKW